MGKVRVSVVGAAGYTGGELLRLLTNHPAVELSQICSESWAGKPIKDAFPGLHIDSRFCKLDLGHVAKESNLVFLAQESGFAMEHAQELLDAGVKVVDLSADFRLKSKDEFKKWYKLDHTSAKLLGEAVYGLPEFFREQIKAASLVANPGCYPTATTLGLAPFVKAGVIELSSIVVDAKSGVSGAGRSKFGLDYHFSEVNENLKPYALGGSHRHTPEIEQNLSAVAGKPLKITFSPHLVPITRGILATSYATLTKAISNSEVEKILSDFYASEPFVKIFHHDLLPSTKSTFGSNYCHIAAVLDDRTNRLVVVSAIDNLVKGASGQAIQNMNLLMGLDETTGLLSQGVWP